MHLKERMEARLFHRKFCSDPRSRDLLFHELLSLFVKTPFTDSLIRKGKQRNFPYLSGRLWSMAAKIDKSRYGITVLGDGGCGKTAVTIMFTSDHFVEYYDPTIERFESSLFQVVPG